jgi:signal transduction histidine kinase
VNPAFERMTGLEADQVVGKTVLEVLPGIEQHWIETYGRVALTNEPIHFESYARELNRHWEVTAFRPTEGQFACIFKDVTEAKQLENDKKKLETQLRRSQKLEMIGTLAGGIAHDFNNILTPISGYIEMALGDLPSSSQTCQDLRRVHKATQRAKDLVQKMLTFSRQMDSEPEAIDLEPIIRETVDLVECSLPPHIRIDQQIDIQCAAVFADPTQIHQVIMNLCTNAVYAMKDTGGLLDIRLQSIDVDSDMAHDHPLLVPGAYVRLTVSDTGEGMATDVLDRVFDPFFTTKGVGEGTGLGLSVVHGIVKGYEGEIIVTSGPGQGTTFAIYLPVMGDRDRNCDSEQRAHVCNETAHAVADMS